MMTMMKKYRASKLALREVPLNEEKAFLNENHYQGFVSSSWCKGLYDGNELLILMSFGKPRFTNKYDYELLRLCTKKGCQVHGGASKLLQAFRSTNIGSIISYCNRDKFAGTVYEALEFKLARTTKGYHYEKDGKSYSRYQFQRKKCLEIWPQYKGTDKTESEIMREQGYIRMNDAIGQAAYILDTQLCKWYIYEIEVNGYHYIGQHKYATTINDNYYGSGMLLNKVQKKYGSGTKTILLDNIMTQDEADKYEKCAIALCKTVYGEFYKHNGKCLNIRDNGQGHWGTTYGTLGKVSCISPDGKKHYLKREEVPEGWTIGSFKANSLSPEAIEKISQKQKENWANGVYGEPWNKGKKMENIDIKGIQDGAERRKAKVNSMIPEGWIRLKEAADKLGCCRQTVLKHYESRVIMEGKQKVTIVKL